LQRSIGDIEIILGELSRQYKESLKAVNDTIAESNRALSKVKEELHQISDVARECGYHPIPATSISDPKLNSVWQTLYWYHEGATADTIAQLLGKHRTTVSTYLNMLVSENYAEKERIGHEIYYKAKIQTEE
jgi:response regulator of citrate/malate metabolism